MTIRFTVTLREPGDFLEHRVRVEAEDRAEAEARCAALRPNADIERVEGPHD